MGNSFPSCSNSWTSKNRANRRQRAKIYLKLFSVYLLTSEPLSRNLFTDGQPHNTNRTRTLLLSCAPFNRACPDHQPQALTPTTHTKTKMKTPSLKTLANRPTGLTEAAVFGLWYIRTGQVKLGYETLHDIPLISKTTPKDRSALQRAFERVQNQWIAAERAAERQNDIALMRRLLTVMRGRKVSNRLLGKEWKLADAFRSLTGSRQARHDLASLSHPDEKERLVALRSLGASLHRFEHQAIARHTSPAHAFAYARSLPLYACSGELEADSLHLDKRQKLGSRRTAFWDVGRDGGGQFEIRFRLSGNLPALASGMVSRLGTTSRNGGHIHLNCQGDEQIGTRVFNKMREQLSWMRYLCPLHRRRGRWSSVDAVQPTFAAAKSVKGAALSTYAWNKTGTVEMRIWGTTDNPAEWSFRARLMQSVARMSETLPVEQVNQNALMDSSARRAAWSQFYTWTAQNDPQILRETLHALRKKGRTTRDSRGAERARECVADFDASGVRLSGYRRRTTITENNITGQTVTA